MRTAVHKTWVEVSGAALTANLRELRHRLGRGVQTMAVVKANAYGHGLAAVAGLAVRRGAEWLGVDSVDEAHTARLAARSSPLLILGYTPHSRVIEAVNLGARLTIYDPRTLKIAARGCKTARLHIKLETGTTRQGVGERGLMEILRSARRTRRVIIEGLSTHYANIEDTTDHRYAARQLREFTRLSTLAEKIYGRSIPVKHSACSAAAILFPETYFTLARLGLALYGLWPSRETRISAQERGVKLKLRPALTWKSLVAQVKEVAAGTPVSYGLTVRLTRRSRVAVIPVGYYDGFDRGLSSVGAVLIHGRRAPVLGRVCMNMFMADVTDIPRVQPEDEVVLIGAQGREAITADELANKLGTINYEIVSRINPNLPRISV